jgi:hypothetical protein
LLSGQLLSRRKFLQTENGTILLWTIGVFSVSLLVLAGLMSIASYFSQTMELQSRLELSATNASDRLDYSNFYLTGEISDVVFEDASLLIAITKDLKNFGKDFERFKILSWRVEGREFWLEISHPWVSPIGNFSVLPDSVTASVHLKLDSNRHLQ